MDTFEEHKALFTNNVYSNFTAELTYVCEYKYSTPPSFASNLTEFKVEAGIAETLDLPVII